VARIVDLSHRLEPGMPVYPGLPPMRFDTVFTHTESLDRGAYAPGTSFQIGRYELPGNTGTYVDAPLHRHPEAADLARFPLESLADLPGVVIDARADGAIGAEAFAAADLAGRAVLIRTGWSARWGGDGYFRSGPFLTAAACAALVHGGAALVGIDCANIDDMTDPTRPAHTTLLGADLPVVEHLCGLDALPSEGFRFFAVPPAIVGGTAFPVRAFAIIP
jgi:kynurenine formamidase